MYVTAIRRLLEMYPAGASCEQILYHLRASGARATATDILQNLNMLSGNGEVGIVAEGRWLLIKFSSAAKVVTPGSSQSISGKPEPQPKVLRAIAGQVLDRPPSDMAVSGLDPALNDEGSWSLDQHWRPLLHYYAATQRADPRGKATQFPDRHGESWQLFSVRGRWWKDAHLRFAIDDLPGALREALSRRNEAICALGYPVSLFDSVDGATMLPALLISASWRLEDHYLFVELADMRPIVNPDWLKQVVAKSAWKADALLEALFPIGEEADLDAVASRMRNALAKLGGGSLLPARLADELALGSDGLGNSAAIFLPSDARFTQGTAADLGAIADWSEEDYRRSALHHLFSASAGDSPSINFGTPVPLLQLRDMTDAQFCAARVALDGPLTLIQGPPGTGKSEVIVSLLASIFMASDSVLFASRNHQALDEVEERLSKLVGDNPVLTRGRDAEGDRDTNFLAALKELSVSEPIGNLKKPTIDELVALAMVEASNRSLQKKRADLEIELARAIERALALDGGSYFAIRQALDFARISPRNGPRL
jgi:hypothetical protein